MESAGIKADLIHRWESRPTYLIVVTFDQQTQQQYKFGNSFAVIQSFL